MTERKSFADLGLHWRSELKIILYDGDKAKDVPNITAKGMIPLGDVELTDAADPAVRAEVLELIVEGLNALVERDKESINQSDQSDQSESETA